MKREARIAAGNSFARPGLGLPCPIRAFGKEKPVECWSIHHAHDRLAVFDDRDVDGELSVLVDELLGAVERVDQREADIVIRDPAGCD